MVRSSFVSKLKRFCQTAHRNRKQGFTLTELLVVTMIAAGIISGLVYIVVELLGSDQREASRNETQRELQMAMNYISAELREAVYVYSGTCLDGSARDSNNLAVCDRGGPNIPLTNFLPASLTDSSVPVIAFWRQYPIPQALNNTCLTWTPEAAQDNPQLASIPCLTAHSYALVVYSLSTKNTNNTWKGRARITRYALTQFNDQGVPTTGWVSPDLASSFERWPFGSQNGVVMNLQAGRPTSNPQVLVDFVDDGRGGEEFEELNNVELDAACPNINTFDASAANLDYSLSPTSTMLANAGLSRAETSFYACVSVDPATSASGSGTNRSGVNPDVLLYVRGNAYGRPGVSSDGAFLPTLETRVLTRGVLARTPAD